MDRRQAEDLRAVELMTRWTLVLLQEAERGTVPVKALERFVDPAVVTALGHIEPPGPGQPRQRPRVGRPRIHLVHDRLAHVACVAATASGPPAGYVLEFRRESLRQPWRVVELTRVEERRLVRQAGQELVVQDDDRSRRLPADLTGLIASTEQARAAAVDGLERAQGRLQELRGEVEGLKGKSTWKARERKRVGQQERAARATVERWKQEVKDLDGELEELRDVQELREVRQLVVDGDPLVKARNPVHLERLLGPVPDDREQRSAWRRAASTVERYRDAWGIADRENALGELPDDAPAEQREQREKVVSTVESYVGTREQQREHAPDGEDLELDL